MPVYEAAVFTVTNSCSGNIPGYWLWFKLKIDCFPYQRLNVMKSKYFSSPADGWTVRQTDRSTQVQTDYIFMAHSLIAAIMPCQTIWTCSTPPDRVLRPLFVVSRPVQPITCAATKQYFQPRPPTTATQFDDPETYLFTGKQRAARSSPYAAVWPDICPFPNMCPGHLLPARKKTHYTWHPPLVRVKI